MHVTLTSYLQRSHGCLCIHLQRAQCCPVSLEGTPVQMQQLNDAHRSDEQLAQSVAMEELQDHLRAFQSFIATLASLQMFVASWCAYSTHVCAAAIQRSAISTHMLGSPNATPLMFR